MLAYWQNQGFWLRLLIPSPLPDGSVSFRFLRAGDLELVFSSLLWFWLLGYLAPVGVSSSSIVECMCVGPCERKKREREREIH